MPDGGILHPAPDQLYYPTAALVVEIVSPYDETWAKLPFYAAHDVEEVLIVDPKKHEVQWLALRGDLYEPIERSGLIELGPRSWPSGSPGRRLGDSSRAQHAAFTQLI